MKLKDIVFMVEKMAVGLGLKRWLIPLQAKLALIDINAPAYIKFNARTNKNASLFFISLRRDWDRAIVHLTS
jgi:hypothetical protein